MTTKNKNEKSLLGEIIKDERSSSVEVSRNAKKEFSFKVKIYFDEEKRKPEDVLKKIEQTYKLLEKTFDKPERVKVV